VREGVKDEDRGCANCTDDQRVKRGCDGGVSWQVGRWTVDGCPEKLLTPERVEAIRTWVRWKKFGAPYSGGWATWPCQLVDVLEAFEEEVTLEEQRKQDTSGD
jgi:hypothetical protein